jgi:hypothetical protein
MITFRACKIVYISPSYRYNTGVHTANNLVLVVATQGEFSFSIDVDHFGSIETIDLKVSTLLINTQMAVLTSDCLSFCNSHAFTLFCDSISCCYSFQC